MQRHTERKSASYKGETLESNKNYNNTNRKTSLINQRYVVYLLQVMHTLFSLSLSLQHTNSLPIKREEEAFSLELPEETYL